MGDDIDISDLPAPPSSSAGDVDISDLPVPPADDSGTAHAKRALQIVKDHPFTAGIGMFENALSGAAGGFADLANAVTGHEPDAPDERYAPAKWTQPHTEAGKKIAELAGEETSNLGKQYDKIPGADTPLGQTIKRYGPEALGAVSTAVPLIKGAGAGAGRVSSGAVEAGHISDFGGSQSASSPTAPTPAVEGPVTAEALRAQPDPLAPAAPAAEPTAPASVSPEESGAPEAPARRRRVVPVPGKPHIKLKVPRAAPAPAAAEPAPAAAAAEPAPVPSPTAEPEPVRFTPPSAEGASVGDLPGEHQAARLDTLHRLNALAGNQLGEVRTSALSGNTGETGQDWAHAKVQDLGGKRMQEVIGNETNALRAAADTLVERTGTVSEGVDQPSLNRRGTIVSKAISGIEDWFNNNIKDMYETAKARARGVPIQDMTSLKTLAGDESNFAGTTEGEALYRGVQSRARKLGLVGEDGVFKPATVEQAEQFRQYLGEQWTPRTSGLINKLKDALDEDVARHGGTDLFTKARALRSQKGKMLEDPTGIAKLLHPDDRLGINRDVPLNEVPDYIANLDPEQFHHVVNVLKSAAHLGDGELAEPAAAALREIKGHMAARLHEAGSARIQGGWDAKNFYKQLNDYSLKMPSVFSPGELVDWKTVNDASNVLRMDRTYKGAMVEAHNVGFGTKVRAKAGALARGGVDAAAHHALPIVGPAVAEATGLSERIGRMVGGNPEAVAERARLGTVEGRITKLEPKLGGSQPPKVRPTSQTGGTGSPILPPRQRGAVGNLNAAKPLKGAPVGDQPNMTARESAAAYTRAAGVKSAPLTEYRYIKPEVAKAIATAYDKMAHEPNDPKVKAAYDAFKRETKAQWAAIKKTGLNVDFKQPYPYGANPREVIEDVRNNNHMTVFPTEGGFGTEVKTNQHPLLENSGVKIGGKEVTYNDLFRIVHDYYGHIAEGNGFRAQGEYNAWRNHRTMYSAAAQPAMDSETLGQNAWVNHGPHAETNKGATQEKTVYADQKAGLLPPGLVKTALAGTSAAEHVKASANDALFFKHYSELTGKSVELDPKYYGKGLTGAERMRIASGAPKVVSAYGPKGEVEPELRNKTEYQIKVPKKEMYDLSADPKGFKQAVMDENSGVYDHSEVERMIKEAGYTGYHLPEGQGIFKGQARFFRPIKATRAGYEKPKAPKQQRGGGAVFAEAR